MTLVAPAVAPDHVPADWSAPVGPVPEQPSSSPTQPAACTGCGAVLPAHDLADPTSVRGYLRRPGGSDVDLVVCAPCYLSD